MKSLLKIAVFVLAGTVLASGVVLAEKGEGQKQGKQKNAAKAFERMDSDGSGGVTLEEFTAAHEKRLAKRAEKRAEKGKQAKAGKDGKERPSAEQIFGKIDADGDQSITLSEFRSHMKERKAKKQGRKNQ